MLLLIFDKARERIATKLMWDDLYRCIRLDVDLEQQERVVQSNGV